MDKDHPLSRLSEALEAAGHPQGRAIPETPVTTSKAIPAGKAVPQKPTQDRFAPFSEATKAHKMILPQILVDEAARLLFDYWERHAAEQQKVTPVAWEQLTQRYQDYWRESATMVLEMGISLILRDAVYTLDHSNGDMGGAFAKALTRYMRERLSI